MASFSAEFQQALDLLRQGFIDQGIDLWESTFKQSESSLTLVDRLWEKIEYAQTLLQVAEIDRAREVDHEIVEEIEKHSSEELEEINDDERNDLLTNIGQRWDSFVTVDDIDDFNWSSRPPKPPTPVPKPSRHPLEREPSLRRTQSFTEPVTSTPAENVFVGNPPHAPAVSHNVAGDVLISQGQTSANSNLQGFDLRSE
jgi:hypothetical protein